jgi:hypothetical protein
MSPIAIRETMDAYNPVLKPDRNLIWRINIVYMPITGIIQ